MRARGLWWRLAVRNLRRNSKRTALASSALAFGFAAAVVMVALSDGMNAELVDNGTRSLTGQVQIHARDYLPARHSYATIGAGRGDVGNNDVPLERLLQAIDSASGVSGATLRVYGGGLLSAGEHTVAAQLLGVDPSRERAVSNFLSTMVQGHVPPTGSRDVALGEETVRRLHVAVGDTIVIVAQSADGSLGNDLYVVGGIYHTGLDALDAGMAVLPLDALQALLVLAPDRVHEIAVAIRNPRQAADIARVLATSPLLSSLQVVVEPWNTLRPELASYAALAESTNGFFIAIVFLMTIFGVTNTLLMSTFERRREFAMVQALGVDGRKLARTIVYEGVVLGMLSLAAGALMAAPILYWWHRSPLDLSRFVGDITMSGALMHPVFRADPSWSPSLIAAFALLITSILAALYPAWRATRVPPADALAGRE